MLNDDRKNHIGASESAAILGLSPYATAYDIWATKTGRVEPWQGNEATAIGQMVENGLLDWAESILGRMTLQAYRVHPGGILSATHDGLLMDRPEGCEAKTACILGGKPDQWGDEGTDEIPDQYLVQCQHQMAVSDLQMVHVPALIGGIGRRMYRVERNEDVVRMLVDRLSAWWERHIVHDTPPDNCGPSPDIAKRIRRTPGKTIRIDAGLVAAWREAEAAAKAAEKAAKEAKSLIMATMLDAEAGECDLGRLTVMKSQRKGYVVEPCEMTTVRWKEIK
jgi:putative phage-type endonuclease